VVIRPLLLALIKDPFGLAFHVGECTVVADLVPTVHHDLFFDLALNLFAQYLVAGWVAAVFRSTVIAK
jgi:hypothetical protein